MKRRLKAQGVKANKAGLAVYLVIEVGSTMRFAEVQIPAFMLTADEVIQRIEKQQALELKARWEGNTPLPLEAWEE